MARDIASIRRLATEFNSSNVGPWNYVQPRPNQQVPTYGLVSAYDPELYRHQFNPPAALQPPYTYMDSYALLRSPYDGPQNPPLPPYKPDRDQLHHGHQPIDYQQPPLTAGAAANLPHQNYQPVGQQRCTRKPPLDWPQPPPQHSPSCWCPPTATPPPTAAVPISTPPNGFVEIQHLPHPPQHAQFQIFVEPISDSSDVEMPITEEFRTEELPPNEDEQVKQAMPEEGSLCYVVENRDRKKPIGGENHSADEKSIANGKYGDIFCLEVVINEECF
ncbi:hypothetical protein SASPL_131124 [Salvia splendens]|uniref:Uncharacterized protein n=1 Tax=Salvia splendens TaxID=180675 RepID=A0A8X8XAD3_SALSN|nr:hypothetical protein SASPL_131124 [Salvia splendens]